MICFKDMTFCQFWEECGKKPCPDGRELTDEVCEQAQEWWGEEGAPICKFTEKPECFKEKIDKDVCEHEPEKAMPNPYGITEHCKKCGKPLD